MKLSIITINYNNIVGLRKTVDSILNQSYSDFEWIVIDGGSNDGSREIIENNSSHFSYWCCEPDNGIYNALNKGLLHAHGEYVQFLNSGDWLYSHNTLEDAMSIIESKESECEIFYGNMIQVNNGGHLNPIIYPENLGLFFFLYYNICHQATFYKRHLFNGNFYDESFSIVSDWAMNLKLMFDGHSFNHIDLTIVYYDNTGLSSIADNKHHMERTAALSKYLPIQIMNDVEWYNKSYYFTRLRKSTRWIMDHSITFCQWINKFLCMIEERKKRKINKSNNNNLTNID